MGEHGPVAGEQAGIHGVGGLGVKSGIHGLGPGGNGDGGSGHPGGRGHPAIVFVGLTNSIVGSCLTAGAVCDLKNSLIIITPFIPFELVTAHT